MKIVNFLNKYKWIFTTILVSIIIIIFIYQNFFYYEGSGNVINQTREIQEFNKIEIKWEWELYIKQTTQTWVIIQAEDNILDTIKTYTIWTKLIIRKNLLAYIKHKEPIKIYISINDLNRITIEWKWNVIWENSISTDNLEINSDWEINMDLRILSKNLYLDSEWGGDILLRWTAKNFQAQLDWSINLKAYEFINETCSINMQWWVADISVLDRLDAKIWWNWILNYKWKPKINQEISSNSQINKQ